MFHIDLFFEYSSGVFLSLNLLQSRLIFFKIEYIDILFSAEAVLKAALPPEVKHKYCLKICADQIYILLYTSFLTIQKMSCSGLGLQ